jgi:hypothetical protein
MRFTLHPCASCVSLSGILFHPPSFPLLPFLPLFFFLGGGDSISVVRHLPILPHGHAGHLEKQAGSAILALESTIEQNLFTQFVRAEKIQLDPFKLLPPDKMENRFSLKACKCFAESFGMISTEFSNILCRFQGREVLLNEFFDARNIEWQRFPRD